MTLEQPGLKRVARIKRPVCVRDVDFHLSLFSCVPPLRPTRGVTLLLAISRYAGVGTTACRRFDRESLRGSEKPRNFAEIGLMSFRHFQSRPRVRAASYAEHLPGGTI